MQAEETKYGTPAFTEKQGAQTWVEQVRQQQKCQRRWENPTMPQLYNL